MSQSNADVLAVQLERVLTKIPTLYDSDDNFYSTIEKRGVEVVSRRDMRVPLKVKPGGFFGHFDPAGGDLGRGSGAIYDKAIVTTVDLRHAVEWDTETQWATDSRRKAVINSVNQLIADAMPDFRKHTDSLSIGSAGQGRLGVIASISGSGPTVVTCTEDFGVKLLRAGQKISVVDASHTGFRTNGQNILITAIDIENKSFTVAEDLSGDTVATDIVIVEGLAFNGTSLYGVEYHQSAASTGTWLGLNRANVPEIRSNEVDAGSSGLSLPFPRLAINKIGNRLGMKRRVNLEAWCHPCQTQAYEELGQLVSIINKEAREQSLDLYFNRNMQMAGAPCREHFSWSKSRIDFINKSTWGRAEMRPAGFYTVGGNRLFEARSTDGGVAAATLLYITASFQLFVDNPAAGSYIINLDVPSGY